VTSQDIVGSGVVSFRGTLAATVSATGKLTLILAVSGCPLLSDPGRYRIAVDDRTSKSGFMLQQIRKRPVTLTGSAFVGKHTVTLDLNPASGCSTRRPVRSSTSSSSADYCTRPRTFVGS